MRLFRLATKHPDLQYGRNEKKIRILYLGPDYGTSRHRADALRRIGHNVEIIDPWKFLPYSGFPRKLIAKLVIEFGAAPFEPYIRWRLFRFIKWRRFDLIWNNQCHLIGPETAVLLKRFADCTLTYANDDPFGRRDGRVFSLYRRSIRHFDLAAVVRQPNVAEARAWGAASVALVRMSADEVAHRPLDLSSRDKDEWSSQVAFIGTWMPERGSFLARLIELGVPLTIRGDRWSKSKEWFALKGAWSGPGIDGPDYVKAIQCAKVCLGLLSKENRDLHTTRSAEIPYIGSVLCAERTSEHLEMYREDEEAVFWSTPEECAEKCFDLLGNLGRCEAIASAGRERCIRDGYLNENIVASILATLSGHGGNRAHVIGMDDPTCAD